MSRQELKQEINKVIDEIPEPVLGEILDYLKQLNSMSKDKIDGANH
jgi:hypothetical protein